MDQEHTAIPSSECSEVEPISSNIEDINEPNTANIENDCRINCTDSKSLRDIFEITLNHIEELADSCNLKDSRADFVSVFGESFKNALQENILVNGLPLMIDESKQLSLSQKEDHLHTVDDVLFAKLSKKVANVAQERKFYPQQCSRILNIEMKHELQNLKKAKVTHSSLPSTSSQSSVKFSSQNRDNLKQFSDFCQGFGTMQETVQCKMQEKEKLNMKLNLVQEVHKKQKLCSKINKNDKSSGLQEL